MARGSLLLVVMLAVGTASCLVTAEPDFSPPERTRPQILTTGDKSPEPSLAEIATFWKQAAEDFGQREFSAWIVSEDVGLDVYSVLLIDYGIQSDMSNGPYRDDQPGGKVEPGSFLDGPRRVGVRWAPRPMVDEDGCHTVTLLVTHEFAYEDGRYWCPADPDDSSAVTWFVNVCNDTTTGLCSFEGCSLSDTVDTNYCASSSP